MQLEVSGVIERLRTVPVPRFQPVEICSLLEGTQIHPQTLAPYLHFAKGRYTRNLIFRNELFELIALCWDAHTQSPIHNHANQLCWLSIQEGALRLENFHSLNGPGPGDNIQLVPVGGIARAETGCLDLQQGDDGIHRVSNPFAERAVSLHVYSLPYDSCLAYDLAAHTSRELPLRYWSVEGKLANQ